MVFDKQIVIDRIEILEDGQMQVRQATRIFEDGKLISESFHRHVVTPGEDLTLQDARVESVGKVLHTKAVKDAYAIKKAEQQLKDKDPTRDFVSK